MNATTTFDNAGAAAPAKANDDNKKNNDNDRKDNNPGSAGNFGNPGNANANASASANKADSAGKGYDNGNAAPAKDDDGDAGAQVKALRDHVDATWQTARDVVADKTKVASAKAKEVAGSAHAYAREEPWQVAGAALAAGVLIGLLLGRR